MKMPDFLSRKAREKNRPVLEAPWSPQSHHRLRITSLGLSELAICNCNI